MPTKQKCCLLQESLWQTRDSDYYEAMINQILGGTEDEKTLRWEKNCNDQLLLKELLGR